MATNHVTVRHFQSLNLVGLLLFSCKTSACKVYGLLIIFTTIDEAQLLLRTVDRSIPTVHMKLQLTLVAPDCPPCRPLVGLVSRVGRMYW